MVSFSAPWSMADRTNLERLDQIGNELERLAIHLRRHSCGAESRKPQSEADFARRLWKERRERERLFGSDLFADPAWDMLLDLFASEIEGRRISVSSLCLAAQVPATTALRWINALVDRGMIRRRNDPKDQRRIYIELELKTAEGIRSLLSHWMNAGR